MTSNRKGENLAGVKSKIEFARESVTNLEKIRELCRGWIA